MAQQIYLIMAYSPGLNQTQRVLDQDSLSGRHTTDRKLALQKAAAFAQELNRVKKMRATDWRARIELTQSWGN
jgi:hypothetical protein